MKITISLFTLLFMISFSSPLDAQAYNTFEDENNFQIIIDSTNAANIWQIGIPNKSIFTSANTLPYALVTDTVNNYPTDNQSTFQFTINIANLWSQFPYVLIDWAHKMDCDINNDGGIIEVSYDEGQTWTNIFDNHVEQPIVMGSLTSTILPNGEQGISQTFDTWNYAGFCWSSADPNYDIENISLRYTFVSDSIETNQEGWLIDNFEAHGAVIDAVDDLIGNQSGVTGITIFPNPAMERIYFRTEAFLPSGNAIVQISDIGGHLIYAQKMKDIQNSEIDISKFRSGYYILTISNPDKMILSKGTFIKPHH